MTQYDLTQFEDFVIPAEPLQLEMFAPDFTTSEYWWAFDANFKNVFVVDQTGASELEQENKFWQFKPAVKK